MKRKWSETAPFRQLTKLEVVVVDQIDGACRPFVHEAEENGQR